MFIFRCIRRSSAQRNRHRQGARQRELPRHREDKRAQTQRIHAMELPARPGQDAPPAIGVVLRAAKDLPRNAAMRGLAPRHRQTTAHRQLRQAVNRSREPHRASQDERSRHRTRWRASRPSSR